MKPLRKDKTFLGQRKNSRFSKPSSLWAIGHHQTFYLFVDQGKETAGGVLTGTLEMASSFPGTVQRGNNLAYQAAREVMTTTLVPVLGGHALLASPTASIP